MEQRNIKDWPELTIEVARHICQEIMGFEYSHHDNNRCYKGDPYGDEVPMIYFYQGMSPSIMKLNTHTGMLHYADTYNLIERAYDVMVETYQLLLSNLNKEQQKNFDLTEQRRKIDENPVSVFRKNADKVYDYLVENDYFIPTQNWEVNYISCEGNKRFVIVQCRESWEEYEVECRFRQSMGGMGDDPAEFVSCEHTYEKEWSWDFVEERE